MLSKAATVLRTANHVVSRHTTNALTTSDESAVSFSSTGRRLVHVDDQTDSGSAKARPRDGAKKSSDKDGQRRRNGDAPIGEEESAGPSFSTDSILGSIAAASAVTAAGYHAFLSELSDPSRSRLDDDERATDELCGVTMPSPWRMAGRSLCAFNRLTNRVLTHPMMFTTTHMMMAEGNKFSSSSNSSLKSGKELPRRNAVAFQDDHTQTDAQPEQTIDNRVKSTTEQLLTCEASLYNMIGLDCLKCGLHSEAFRYFTSAANSGSASANFNLGQCYFKGCGTSVDMKKAVEMWQRAANDGHGDASYQLGVCYVKGIGGLAVNIDLGRSFIQAAAMQKNPSDKAQLHSAVNYLMDGDYEEGMKRVVRAADKHDRVAIDALRCFSTLEAAPVEVRTTARNWFLKQKRNAKTNVKAKAPPAQLSTVRKSKFWSRGSAGNSSSETESGDESDSSSSTSSGCDSDASSIVFDDGRPSTSAPPGTPQAKPPLAAQVEMFGPFPMASGAVRSPFSLTKSATVPNFRSVPTAAL